MHTLKNYLNEIPLPNSGGSQSASIKGYISYSKDMREFLPNYTKALNNFLSGEIEEANVYLEECKKWIKQRNIENWQ